MGSPYPLVDKTLGLPIEENTFLSIIFVLILLECLSDINWVDVYFPPLDLCNSSSHAWPIPVLGIGSNVWFCCHNQASSVIVHPPTFIGVPFCPFLHSAPWWGIWCSSFSAPSWNIVVSLLWPRGWHGTPFLHHRGDLVPLLGPYLGPYQECFLHPFNVFLSFFPLVKSSLIRRRMGKGGAYTPWSFSTCFK